MEPPIRDAISAIHLARLADGTWHARASISRFVAGGRVAQTERATITFDDRDLPDGVSTASWTRLPDRRAVLDADIEAQLAALRASGLLGPLHATRFGPVRGGAYDGRCTYVVKPLRYPAGSVLGQRVRDHRGVRP